MKTILIEVTEKDVKRARIEYADRERLDCCCPTKQALNRYLNTSHFRVGIDAVTLPDSFEEIGCLNGGLYEQVINFTFDRDFAPSKYEIQIDEKYLKEQYK